MNLKTYRKSKNLTQERISELINVAPSTYRGYEANTSEPTIETLKKLADIFQISLDELCDRQFKNQIKLEPYQREIYNLLPTLTKEQCSAILSMINAFNVPTTKEDLLTAQLIKKYGDK